MPVDPGHLTLLAPVRGSADPGGARQRPLCPAAAASTSCWSGSRPVCRSTPGALPLWGVGGLKKTLHVAPPAARRPPPVAAVVLAAGQSRRMGAVNKLLAVVSGAPMLAGGGQGKRSLRALATVYLVTGFERARVEAALAGRDVQFVHNPTLRGRGSGTSIAAGLAALPRRGEGALVCLGDMPAVSAEVLDRIIAAFDPRGGAAVCVPTCRGQTGEPRAVVAQLLRGNPWGSRAMPARGTSSASTRDAVREVPVDDSGILLDIDSTGVPWNASPARPEPVVSEAQSGRPRGVISTVVSRDLYHRAILEAAAAAVGAGELPSRARSGERRQPSCAETASEAAASVIGGSARGASTGEVSAVRGEVAAMLRGGPGHFDPPWEALEMFMPAREFRSRHECVTLAFDALAAALCDAEARGPGTGGEG